MSRILFITSNRLGDAVLSTGLLGHLTERFPGARLTVACGPLPAPLFRAVPGLERLIPLPKRSFARHWLRLWLDCVTTRWDLVVDLRNSAVGRLVPARRRAFHAKAARPMHKVEENAAVLGLSPPPAPRLWIDAAARAEADALIPAGTGRFLAIGPTANWQGKEWPADRFARLALRLTGAGGPLEGARVAVLAAGPERERALPVLEALGPRAIDLTGRTDPMAAAACLERAALYVGNDSGLMHIAAAAGVPTVGLFGPGYPEIYGPWGSGGRAVTGSVPRADLLALVAADAGARGLMDGIAEDAVAAAADDLLEARRAARPPGTAAGCDQFAATPGEAVEVPPLR
ncbi:glycosyltransferase family 9 protein [Azospirillum picis]|uniref:Lipopolysaccharide export system permease protein n=1 Tax=Azospirillum picis TaxID=488438 RepID=A0ABU0MHW1_9PROT|nr:glycosyltransferase family 9 protein [Azospirillum picis]MBP2299311.1 lipopolysaccharide export system permease protein [Azospirillum picis]MDQ0533051.1 lipopolysaccharide export system permease protein [Azospirillum picis]